ncbi:MAG: hypothetical protein C0506_05315 [Anaerolinea sp.]|nr:hypothetical protein [Anaerolinea sp.]
MLRAPLFALCSLLFALCSLLSALCSLLFALCSLLFARRSCYGEPPALPHGKNSGPVGLLAQKAG